MCKSYHYNINWLKLFISIECHKILVRAIIHITFVIIIILV